MSFSRTAPELVRGHEVTLLSAAVVAMPHDFRLLGVLVAWLEVHHAYVNVPRLKRLVSRDPSAASSRAFWSAVGTWLGATDTRWRALVPLHAGPPVSLDDPEVTTLQLARVGPDPRFAESSLVVHAKLLRSRRADVDEPATVAKRHRAYRMRVRLGPTYRADVWCALDETPDASPAAIARRVGCAYETARAVAVDWRLDRSIAA